MEQGIVSDPRWQFDDVVADALSRFCSQAAVRWPSKYGTSYCLVNLSPTSEQGQRWRVFLESDPTEGDPAIELSFTLTETGTEQGCVVTNVEALRRAEEGGIEVWDEYAASWRRRLPQPAPNTSKQLPSL